MMQKICWTCRSSSGLKITAPVKSPLMKGLEQEPVISWLMHEPEDEPMTLAELYWGCASAGVRNNS